MESFGDEARHFPCALADGGDEARVLLVPNAEGRRAAIGALAAVRHGAAIGRDHHAPFTAGQNPRQAGNIAPDFTGAHGNAPSAKGTGSLSGSRSAAWRCIEAWKPSTQASMIRSISVALRSWNGAMRFSSTRTSANGRRASFTARSSIGALSIMPAPRRASAPPATQQAIEQKRWCGASPNRSWWMYPKPFASRPQSAQVRRRT